MQFAQRGSPQLVKAAIDAGSEIDAVRRGGETALVLTVRAMKASDEENYTECARMLLEAGANPNHMSVWGTPTGCAKVRSLSLSNPVGETVFQMLVAAGGDPDGVPESVETFKIAVGMPFDDAVSQLTEGGYTEELAPPSYLQGAKWPGEIADSAAAGRCFYLLRYGGWLFIEPALLVPLSPEEKLVGRIILWHTFHRHASQEIPVYPDIFELPKESYNAMDERLYKAFSAELNRLGE